MTPQMYTSRFTLSDLLHAFSNNPRPDGWMQTHLCPTICEIIRADHEIPYDNDNVLILETNIFEVLYGLSPEDFRSNVGYGYSVLETELKDYEKFMAGDVCSNFPDELCTLRVNFISHLIANVGDVQLEFTAKEVI
jgi:hypothetical protein